MKVAKLKTETRVRRDTYNNQQKIMQYGEDNAYPQDMLKLVNASRTAKSCLRQWERFVAGQGFATPTLNEVRVNSKQTLLRLHRLLAADWVAQRGFAVLVGYNGLLEEVSYKFVPFETCRLEVDKEKNLTGRVAVHPDWTKESGKKFKTEDIKYYNQYTADKNEVYRLVAEAGGFSQFNGLIYYFTGDATEYPENNLDTIRELMATQASSDNIRVRNTKYNFMPAGILYRKKGAAVSNPDDPTDGELGNDEADSFVEDIEQWQGSETAAKIIVIDQDIDEEGIEFKPFPINNLDKYTESTDKEVKEGIRSFLCVPPELMGLEGGRGFASDVMQQAYDYFNSVTEAERKELESAYSEVFGRLLERTASEKYEIVPLSYLNKPTNGDTSNN